MAFGTQRLRARQWALPSIDLRLVGGIVLVAVALMGSVRLASELRITEPVVVAARTIPAGQVIAAGDLTVSEARLEGTLSTLAVGEAELNSLVGQTAAQTIHAGGLVLRADVGAGPVLGVDDVAVTIAVGADTVFSQLRRGDTVAVLETLEPGRPASETSVLMERAIVYAVTADAARVTLGSGSADTGGGRISNVTLVVPRAELERVTHALVNGRLTLALAPREAAP